MSLSPCACSVHTHCTFCDGKDTPQAMAEAAFQAGVRYFGLSSHSHTPLPEDEGTTLPKDMAAYRETVLRLRAEYEGRMEILLGIELDNLSDVSPAGFDYWIGSAHHLRAPGGPHTVDWDEAHLTACLEEAFHGDGLAMAEAYYQEVRRMAARFSDQRTAPPPVATICPFRAQTSVKTSFSIFRKAPSPSCAKISGMDFPAVLTISPSRSTKGFPESLASSWPTVVLPLPGIPVKTRLVLSRQSWAMIRSVSLSGMFLSKNSSSARLAWATSMARPPV